MKEVKQLYLLNNVYLFITFEINYIKQYMPTSVWLWST